MRTRLTIGEFSAMTHLSVKTLRRYHENGLLDPAEVDAWTGYRYYAPRQIGVAQSIRRLRELDMPVREIADLLADPDERRRHDLLVTHLRRLEERLEQTRASVAALRRLLGPDEHPITVERRAVGRRVVASVIEVIDRGAILDWFPAAMAEIEAALSAASRTPDGPAGSLVEDAIFTDDRGRLTVFLPVADPPTAGRVAPLTLPAVELAVTTHVGSHADIDVTYGRLARGVLDRGLDVGGHVRETYLVGPRDTATDADWRTEIGWPVTAG